MKNRFFISTALIMLACTAQAGERQRIVNGTPVPQGSRTFQVALYDTNRPELSTFCDGVLLTEQWVLTARHCLEAGVSKVLTGTVYLDDPNGQRHYPTDADVFLHPDADVAMIKLPSPAIGVTPIGIIAEQPSAGTMLTVSGWGWPYPIQLHKVNVPLTTRAYCKDAYPGEIDVTELCAGFEQGEKDACYNDSGGPLTTTGSNPELVGIVSWGSGCALPGKPGVYVRVTVPKVRNWINRTMENN